MNSQKTTIVVLIPCLNEEITIGKVIRDFQEAIPEAEIIVFDNNSTDRTANIAEESGAKVFHELRPGKGHVIASMFRKVKADYYVIVDGDDTYSAEHVRQLLKPVLEGNAEMAVASRLTEYSEQSFRPLHVFGNNLVRRLVNWIFHSNLTDIMSGYRVCSRELVQSVPIFSSGFEVETEITIRTMDYGFRITEVPVPYRNRPEGSSSKLRTFHDGFRILSEIARIAKAYKPFTFFGAIGLVFIIIGGISGIWVILDYLEDEYVNKVPTAILATGTMLLGFGSIGMGILLNTINYRFRENLRLMHNKINSR
ncbi:MAG: Undecaprenyl-phosphate mannosyltransferase [Deltaproteobacteria bacterium]|jgi:glycosyltransferase involved in cell wall biosynthesis|nr:Undecaprenyl-phosphate mannosyltransferase [Deltaproteobacteria bacterium]